MTPRISVLMPVYMGERYIRAAIDSILRQTRGDFELIVLNDCSPDASREIAAAYPDPRIRILDNPTNLGQTRTLNRGLQEARAPLVARMDQDDVSLPHRFGASLAFLDDHPATALMGTSCTFIDEGGEFLLDGTAPQDPREIRIRSLLENPVCHSSALFRRDIVRDLGGYDEAYRCSQDYALWSTLIRKGLEVRNLPEVHVQIRKHGASASAGFRNGVMFREAAQVVQANLAGLLQESRPMEEVELILRVTMFEEILPLEEHATAMALLDSLYRTGRDRLGDPRDRTFLTRLFADVFYRHGVLLLNSGDSRCARSLLGRALRTSPAHLRALAYLGLSYLGTERITSLRALKTRVRSWFHHR